MLSESQTHTLGLSLCVSVQYRWNLTMFGCSSCVRLSKTICIFSSWDLKFFLSENCTSFHTTSTPSSVSMARWAQSMPGTSRCSTYLRNNKKVTSFGVVLVMCYNKQLYHLFHPFSSNNTQRCDVYTWSQQKHEFSQILTTQVYRAQYNTCFKSNK